MMVFTPILSNLATKLNDPSTAVLVISRSLRGKHLDHSAGQRGAAHGHKLPSSLVLAISLARSRGISCFFAVKGHSEGIFAAILAAHPNLKIVFSDGLHGGIVADLSALGIDQVAVVLAVDGDGAAPHARKRRCCTEPY